MNWEVGLRIASGGSVTNQRYPSAIRLKPTWKLDSMMVPQRDCFIMLVEDNDDVRESILTLLQLKGYQTVGVENGEEALRQLCRMDPLPCLILLDLMMPIMDGWQLIQELQRNAIFSAIPVIVLSAISGDHSVFDNVVARFTKTVHDEQLVSVLERICLSQSCVHGGSNTCLGRSEGPQKADSNASIPARRSSAVA